MDDESAAQVRYTIMPDYGDAYGWINDQGGDALGPCHADCIAWAGLHPIPDELHHEFVKWHATFAQAKGVSGFSSMLALDWAAFHAQGLLLTRRLKRELGDSVRVFYQKPYEDPNVHLHERREILDDGTVLELPDQGPRHLAAFDWLPRRIVSGGQTGVDRAALDWACAHRIVHGGWCPKGRRAADGPLSPHYQLQETESEGYRQRTKLNVRDSDATLIFNVGPLDGGTLQTVRFAQQLERAHLLVQLDALTIEQAAAKVVAWLEANRFAVLNVAGPREEKRPGIYERVIQTLDAYVMLSRSDLLGSNAPEDRKVTILTAIDLASTGMPVETQIEGEGDATRAAINRFELRLAQGADDGARRIRGQITLYAEIRVDGELLDEPHFIDLPQLVHSLHAAGWYEIYTCGCGVGGCAGIVEGIHVTHCDGLIKWSFRRPQSAGSLLDPDLSEWERTAVPVSLTFDKTQMLAAIQAFLETVRALVGNKPERFEWPVHGFYVEDLLHLDPTRPYFESPEGE